MHNLSVLVCGGYLIIALLCISLGIYFLYLNKSLNKLVFAFCLSLGCWCFGAALSLGMPDYEESLLWRRFAAIGEAGFYGFFLHYLFLFTKKKEVIKKKWAKCSIYILPIIEIYTMALSKQIASQLYVGTDTLFGLIFVREQSNWNLFFYAYVIIYLTIGTWLLYEWKKKEERENESKCMRFIRILVCLLLIAVLSSFISENLNYHTFLYMIVPLLFFLVVLGICRFIYQQDFIKEDTKEDITFIEPFRTKITKYLSLGFVIGAVMYLVSQYLYNKSLSFFDVAGFTFALLLCGLVVFIIHRFLGNREIKDILYSILLALVIPIITLQYAQGGAITVWAFPFILIMATPLFHNTIILTMISASIVLTQLSMWIFFPYTQSVVDISDYFVRIGLMSLGIIVIHYINKIYVLRLNQLSEKIKTQDLLFLISSHVIQMSSENMKEEMEKVLALICEYVQADRVYIHFFEKQELLENKPHYSGYSKAYIKESLMNQKVKSVLEVPLMSKQQKIGFIKIDYITKSREFDDAFTKMLMTIGNILGEVYIKTSSEKKMERMAYYDQLTNIPNRQLFSKCIDRVIENSSQSGELFGIIFLDLDSFKIVNDTLGHHYGDKILIMIADRLSKCIRKTDTVCRFGGDEFLIMLNDITCKADIETVAAKIIKQLEKPLFINEQEFNITASVGISIFPIDGMDNDTLIKNADIAMYKAKSNGKNQFVFCSKEMKEEIEQSLILTNNLYHAQEREELDIVYQPQIDIKEGEIIAVEALARWNHPQLGLVSPSIFIPIAEHTSLINSIGEWVLENACRQNKKWQEEGLKPVRMAVNVSVSQLLNTNFLHKVVQILEKTGLKAKYLELEITENIAIQESEYIVSVLTKLKELGISIAIDDFGMEYSSLNRIKMLPIDRLKIDMHFVKGILNCDKDKVIVDVIIKLAKDLGLKVIAEGVEVKEQLDYLVEKECDEVQGYYFYKPLSRTQMGETLANITNKQH